MMAEAPPGPAILAVSSCPRGADMAKKRKAMKMKRKAAAPRKTTAVKKKAAAPRKTTAVKTEQPNEGSRDQAMEFFRRARAGRFFPT